MADETIKSLLWKSSYLEGNSAIFERLVRAACFWHDVPFSLDAVTYAATRPEILQAIDLAPGQVIDELLQDYATDTVAAPMLDGLIMDAVAAYGQKLVNEIGD